MKLTLDSSKPSMGVLAVCNYVRKWLQVENQWESSLNLQLGDSLFLNDELSICRYLARTVKGASLYGSTVLESIQVDNLLLFATELSYRNGIVEKDLNRLHKELGSRTYLIGEQISIADFYLWSVLFLIYNGKVLKTSYENVDKWYEKMTSMNQATVQQTIKLLPNAEMCSSDKRAECKEDLSSFKKEEGKFVDLPGAEMGKVVVRFPPEASGYLHIGHAKAALLNQYYKELFHGKLIMRFDDTNPAKEKVDFEQVILGDLELLQIKPDEFTYTSNYFDKIMEYCEQLIKEGKAYVDNTDAETMKLERDQKIPSKNRVNAVGKNLEMWNEMKIGSQLGLTCCVRAKIDMNSANGCMRDPTIYRCKCEIHPRTGDKYKVYPTYDFACPIVDSLEGVTHSLRTTEYHDRNDQFYWFIDALKLRKPFIWDYSRLNMTNTVLSKRKLTWFVEENIVDGWSDPRFPTVRGILRRGMTVQGLKQFIIAQGSSRSVVTMEWDKIWAFNKKVIDPIAPRYTAIDTTDCVKVIIEGVSAEGVKVAKHPKNNAIGEKIIWRCGRVLIQQEDAALMKVGDNVTFINWGNIKINKVQSKDGKVIQIDAQPNLENVDFKKTLKVTWLADCEDCANTEVICVYFDHIISKPIVTNDDDFKKYVNKHTKFTKMMLGEPELQVVKKSEIIQLQRIGFFICDSPCTSTGSQSGMNPIILFHIPDGHTKDSPIATFLKEQKLLVRGSDMPVPGQQSNAAELNSKIVEQGNKVRSLKESKADKAVIKSEVDLLLKLKQDYKSATGIEWKPGVISSECAVKNSSPSQQISSDSNSADLNSKIVEQGNKVRSLKESKADKAVIKSEVDLLLKLKQDYKSATGVEWKPGVISSECAVKNSSPSQQISSDSNSADLNSKIVEQGNKVRSLKESKADKAVIKSEVDLLLKLKQDYKSVTGVEWKPGTTSAECAVKNPPQQISSDSNSVDINSKIVEQGNKVRSLKETKADKAVIKSEVDLLLKLKQDYKSATGVEWKPGTTSAECVVKNPPQQISSDSNSADMNSKIVEQGNKVRSLKESKADKAVIKIEVDLLLKLKQDYKSATGVEWKPDAPPAECAVKNSSLSQTKSSESKCIQDNVKQDTPQKKKKNDGKQAKESNQQNEEKSSSVKKQTRLGMEASKETNLPDWYSQVITKGELIEYYDVSGCYILRPWAFSIWEKIQAFFDVEIKKLGISNCYFPIFVSKSVLEREKTHIADFAPEVAWVTKSGDSDLAEPIAIRPTSETVMYPAYAKWIQSYRDLPLKLNQWNNVVRWEFKHPQPFLRTREFLWQEGHTAYASKSDAVAEVYQILDLYAQVYTDLLAIPVIKGHKTEKEKFAGADFTTTVEAFVAASGRGIQGATSHHLGQNFSKMFDVGYEHPETREREFVYQNSFGLTTRTIGVMVMVHSDNKGLVLPPMLAFYQVVIVPCGVGVTTSESDRTTLNDSCSILEKDLKEAGIRVFADFQTNYSPGWKFNHWELKGVPLRIEIGPKDLQSETLVVSRRDTGEKITIKRSSAIAEISKLLKEVQASLYQKAEKELKEHTIICEKWEDFPRILDQKNLILAPFCEEMPCEDNIKKDSARDENAEPGAPAMGAKSLCIPFEQPKSGVSAGQKCIHKDCSNPAKSYTLFGRSY